MSKCLTIDDSTVEGFGFLRRKFFGGCDVDRSNKKMLVRGKHDHAFLFDAPCKIIVRKKAFGDLLIVGSAPPSIFVSDTLLNIFREAKITGYEVSQSDVRLPFPHEPRQGKYWQLVITGWGGIAHPRSGIVELDQDAYGLKKYAPCTNTRLILNPRQYDGSDLFLVWPLPYKTWVSPRLASLLVARKVKHYELDPVQTHRFERLLDDPVGFGPLPLECYLPLPRAAEVGSSHGIDWFEYARSPYP